MGADPFDGTWKLNVEKSKMLPNTNIASRTMTISTTGSNGYRTTFDDVSKTGKKGHQVVNRILDGKEYPLTGEGVKEGDTQINQRVSESTRKIITKRNGITREITSTISADGKVMTNRRSSPDGEEILIYEKQ
jgi:hypothetical protein